MNRRTFYALLVSGMLAVFALVASSSAGEPGCCAHCGEKLVCQVMCETKTVSVLRYKVESHEHAPPRDCCCDDRWLLGCCKPIRIINLVPHEEVKKYPVRQFVVYKCPRCEGGSPAPVPSEKGLGIDSKKAIFSIAD